MYIVQFGESETLIRTISLVSRTFSMTRLYQFYRRTARFKVLSAALSSQNKPALCMEKLVVRLERIIVLEQPNCTQLINNSKIDQLYVIVCKLDDKMRCLALALDCEKCNCVNNGRRLTLHDKNCRFLYGKEDALEFFSCIAQRQACNRAELSIATVYTHKNRLCYHKLASQKHAPSGCIRSHGLFKLCPISVHLTKDAWCLKMAFFNQSSTNVLSYYKLSRAFVNKKVYELCTKHTEKSKDFVGAEWRSKIQIW